MDPLTGWRWLTDQAVNIAGDLTGTSKKAVSALQAQVNAAFGGAWYVISHPLNDLNQSVAIAAALITGNHVAGHNALLRLFGFVQQTQVNPLKAWAQKQISRLWAAIRALRAWTLQQIHYLEWALKRWTWRLVAKERRYRIEGDKHGLAYTRRHVRWALGIVQKEAASGYRLSLRGQRSIFQDIGADLITRDPLLRDLVTKVIDGAIGLADIEDPILRITIGFLVKQVIDRLGIDKDAGTFLAGLLAPILGQPTPKNLHDVVWAVGGRLNALEAQWAQFYSDGGPEILQAGEEWRNTTSLMTDAALAAMFGLMVADPQAWARDLATVAAPVVDGAVTVVRDGMTLWR